MEKYSMKERVIPFDDTWDVIVVGGGPAGCAAAAAAARDGSKTLLIEATGCLGGMGTVGLVPAWCPFSDKEKIIYRSIAQKVFEACKAKSPHIPKEKLDWVEINPEQLKIIYDDLVTEAGVTVLFNTVLSAVDMQNDNAVSSIIVSNKSGLTAYQAKVYIDCTGDADLAAWAGAEYHKGDDKTGELQPSTHCFSLANVDEYGYLNGTNLHSGNPESPIYQMVDDAKYPLIDSTHICNSHIAPGTVGFNAGHFWNVDNTRPETVSAALMQGRKFASEMCSALAEYEPKTFGGAYVVHTAPVMGIRETRRIVGDYELTKDDYMNRRTFDDEISRNCYYIDIHLSVEREKAANDGNFDVEKRNARYNKGESHGIPYRCLTPKGLDNVLVAGRSISCDRTVQGSVRVMPVCLTTGEAAGAAAAMAAKNSRVNVHSIDVSELRNKLKAYGAYIK